MENDVLYLGAEFKAYVRLEPVGTLNMDDYDFQVEYYVHPKRKVIFKKEDMIRENENEYRACLDTKELGTGTLTCRVTRYIPDGDFDDGLRTDVKIFCFNERIIG